MVPEELVSQKELALTASATTELVTMTVRPCHRQVRMGQKSPAMAATEEASAERSEASKPEPDEAADQPAASLGQRQARLQAMECHGSTPARV